MPNAMPSAEDLMQRARAARENAYAPYSNFSVGAALLATDGTVYAGANVENASFGLAVCAERAAVAAAVADGRRDFTAIAIAGPEGALTSPCGACRQVLSEFEPSLRVTYTAPGGVVETTVAELLPAAFGPKAVRP